jgi:hypothetical protein
MRFKKSEGKGKMLIKDFKKELKELMIKHEIDSIGLQFDDCSDTYGMVDVEMVLTKNEKDYTIYEGYSFDSSDL